MQSPDIVRREIRLVVGYIGPGDFPRGDRTTSVGDGRGNAQENVVITRDNEGGTLSVTVLLRDGSGRKCTSPEYTIDYPN